MTDTLKPRDAKEAEEACAGRSRAQRQGLGGGRARHQARHGPAGARTDSDARSVGSFGVTLYERKSWCFRPGPGTPLAEIEELLEKYNSTLSPLRTDGLRSAARRRGGPGNYRRHRTAQLISPSRAHQGRAARDHFLGVTAVTAGRDHQVGGRVVKNVTGYDMCKLSPVLGTLAL